MADTTPTIPTQPGGSGGVIGALWAFQYQLGLTVEAIGRAASAIEEDAGRVKKAVKEMDEAAAQVENTSGLDRMGPESTNNTGSSSGTAAVLADVTAGLQQQAGRR